MKDWNSLSMRDRASYIRLFVAGGIMDIDSIHLAYNEYKEGGYKGKTLSDSTVKKAMQFFINKGLTEALAAGLVGNLYRESNLNPKAINPSSKAYGIAQWLGPRKKRLFETYGANPTLQLQLNFVWDELNSTHKNGLRYLMNSKSPEEAAKNAMGYYEFMAGPEGAIKEMRKWNLDGERSMALGIRYANLLYGNLQDTPYIHQNVSTRVEPATEAKVVGDRQVLLFNQPFFNANSIPQSTLNNTTLVSNIPATQENVDTKIETTEPTIQGRDLAEVTVYPEYRRPIVPIVPLFMLLPSQQTLIVQTEPERKPVSDVLDKVADDRNTLLQKELEDLILYGNLSEDEVKRQVEDLLFLRAMNGTNLAANGERLYPIGGNLVHNTNSLYVSPIEILPEEIEVSPNATLRRSHKVFSNYDEAKDNPLSSFTTTIRNAARWVKDNVMDIPSGVSNCTLSASLWIDPANPIKNASSIVANPEEYNYVPIEEKDTKLGDILITRNPNDDSYHTMVVSGYTPEAGVYNFDGTDFTYKANEPLLTYSRGGHDVSFIRRNIPLSVYMPNSDGKTEKYFYRYKRPNTVLNALLKKLNGGNLLQTGGKISDKEYLDIMNNVAEKNYKTWGYKSKKEALDNILKAKDYDYRGYYNKYPLSRADTKTHWTDEFKTAYHPTFSNESIYHGKQHSIFNPYGLRGGFWLDDTGTYQPHVGGKRHFKDSGVNIFAPGGGLNEEYLYPITDLPEVIITPTKLQKEQAWRKREGNIAKALISYPTLPNLFSAAEHYANSIPGLFSAPSEITGVTASEPLLPDVKNAAQLMKAGKVAKAIEDAVKGKVANSWIKKLPISRTRYYRQVRPDALDSYRANGVISQFNEYGNNPTEHEVPMFTKAKPSLYRKEANILGDVWVVSKPKSNLTWESVNGAAMSPKYKGEFNKAPISEFEFYQYDPARGYFKLNDELTNAPFSNTPHVDYLNGLSKQHQIEYLTQNGLNDQWLYTLKNNPTHLESALREAAIPQNIQITAENAASITPAQWTAAQDAAIARGDMAEAQRLRDLHFKVSAPNTKTDVPLWTSSEEAFNSFDLSHFGETDSGFFGYGHYLTPIEKYAATYHPVNRKFYANIENPYIGNNDQYFNRIQYVKDRLAMRKENVMRNLRDRKLTKFSKKLGINENTSLEDAERLVDKYIADETIKWNDKYIKYADEFEGKDGVLSWRDLLGIPNKQEGIYREVVVPRGEQIKSADAVTYDNSGARIPLGERDNFNVNDIRYYESPNKEAMRGIKYIEQTPSITSLDAEQQLAQRLESYTPKVGENGLITYKPLNSSDVISIPEEAVEKQIKRFVDSGMTREGAIEYLREQFGYGAMTQNGKTFLLPEKYMITNPEYMKAHDAVHRVLRFDDSFSIPGALGLNPNEAVAMISGEIKPSLGVQANEPLTEKMLDKWLKTTNDKITGRYGFSSKIKDKKKFLEWANKVAPGMLPWFLGGGTTAATLASQKVLGGRIANNNKQ